MKPKSANRRSKAIKYTQLAKIREQQQIRNDLGLPPVEEGMAGATDEDTVQRARGLNKMRDDESVKPVVWLVGKGEFKSLPYCSKISTTISVLAQSNMPGPEPTFHGWDDKPKREVWDQFLDRYQLRDDQNPYRCQEVMESKASDGYGRALGAARKKCIKEHGWDTNKWKGMIPDWCKNQEHWEGLCDYWATKAFKAVSKRNKGNRTDSGRIVVHFGGSRSTVKHADDLEEEMGRKPTSGEVYLRTHTKQKKKPKKRKQNKGKKAATDLEEHADGGSQSDGGLVVGDVQEGEHSEITEALEFADPLNERAHEQVQQMKLDPANSDKPEALLYVEALGGKKHGRIPGFGNHVDDSILPPANKRARANKYTPSAQSSQGQLEKRYFTTEEVQEMMDGKEQRFAEILAEKEQAWNDKFQRSDGQIALLFARLGMVMPPNLVPSMLPIANNLQAGLPFSAETVQPSVLMTGVPNLLSGGLSAQETASQPSMAMPGIPNVLLGALNVSGLPGQFQSQGNAATTLQNGTNWMQPNGYFTNLLSTTSNQ